jgi:hypothetical protein
MPGQRRKPTISAKDARELLNELGTNGSAIRTALQGKSRSQVQKALAARGIYVQPSDIPQQVKLPTAKQVRALLAVADSYNLLGDPEPIVYLILLCVVGAIPFVAADAYGTG